MVNVRLPFGPAGRLPFGPGSLPFGPGRLPFGPGRLPFGPRTGFPTGLPRLEFPTTANFFIYLSYTVIFFRTVINHLSMQ